MSNNVITEATAISAMCIFEHISETLVKDQDEEKSFWSVYQSTHGVAQLRQAALDLAPLVDAAWHAVWPAHFDDSFDWEFIPQLFGAIYEQHQLENTDAGDAAKPFLSWTRLEWESFALKLFAGK